MFRPTKQTDVKFFKYMLHTPYLSSPLDGGIEQCTRPRGERILQGARGHDPDKRYLMPVNDMQHDHESVIN